MMDFEEEVDLDTEPVIPRGMPGATGVTQDVIAEQYQKRLIRAQAIFKEWPIAYPGDVNQVIKKEFGMRLDGKAIVQLARDAREAVGIAIPELLRLRDCMPLPSKYNIRRVEDQHGRTLVRIDYADSIAHWQGGRRRTGPKRGSTQEPRRRRHRPTKPQETEAEVEASEVLRTPIHLGEALNTIVAALTPLDGEQRKRVLDAIGILMLGTVS